MKKIFVTLTLIITVVVGLFAQKVSYDEPNLWPKEKPNEVHYWTIRTDDSYDDTKVASTSEERLYYYMRIRSPYVDYTTAPDTMDMTSIKFIDFKEEPVNTSHIVEAYDFAIMKGEQWAFVFEYIPALKKGTLHSYNLFYQRHNKSDGRIWTLQDYVTREDYDYEVDLDTYASGLMVHYTRPFTFTEVLDNRL